MMSGSVTLACMLKKENMQADRSVIFFIVLNVTNLCKDINLKRHLMFMCEKSGIFADCNIFEQKLLYYE